MKRWSEKSEPRWFYRSFCWIEEGTGSREAQFNVSLDFQ